MKIYHKPYSGYKKEYFEMRNLLIESYMNKQELKFPLSYILVAKKL